VLHHRQRTIQFLSELQIQSASRVPAVPEGSCRRRQVLPVLRYGAIAHAQNSYRRNSPEQCGLVVFTLSPAQSETSAAVASHLQRFYTRVSRIFSRIPTARRDHSVFLRRPRRRNPRLVRPVDAGHGRGGRKHRVARMWSWAACLRGGPRPPRGQSFAAV